MKGHIPMPGRADTALSRHDQQQILRLPLQHVYLGFPHRGVPKRVVARRGGAVKARRCSKTDMADIMWALEFRTLFERDLLLLIEEAALA